MAEVRFQGVLWEDGAADVVVDTRPAEVIRDVAEGSAALTRAIATISADRLMDEGGDDQVVRRYFIEVKLPDGTWKAWSVKSWPGWDDRAEAEAALWLVERVRPDRKYRLGDRDANGGRLWPA